eukprot:Plantae.Rhodophyta-Palmaria_palmata.ctg4525.p1 GENE.Plantae.Rhodophyta-Palmaria_palmata.ctg4525~~Plantae.Rhodophyta-Palmaria_palmata.ctg4525.p1  ORF type:complete len:133 (+),score=8.23 Plantae.Rhodophyta-Palmaria_palmata.ctg4525:143-541(+)
MNHGNEKVIQWFSKEYPDAIQYMQCLGAAQPKASCPPCVDGKATRVPFKSDDSNRYKLLEAMSSDTTGPIAPPDQEGNKYIQIMVNACTGWTDIQLMKSKGEATREIIKSLSKIQALCGKKARRLHTDGAKE